jgi:hypothetical protein
MLDDTLSDHWLFRVKQLIMRFENVLIGAGHSLLRRTSNVPRVRLNSGSRVKLLSDLSVNASSQSLNSKSTSGRVCSHCVLVVRCDLWPTLSVCFFCGM